MINVKSILVCVLLICSVAITGCKNGDSGLLSGENKVTALQLTPASVTLAVNTTQEYTVTAYCADGTTKNVTDQVAWSFDSDIVTLQNNVATALQSGQTDITATLGNVTSNTATITVSGAQMSRLSVLVDSPQPQVQGSASNKGGMLTLALGNNQGFRAIGHYDDGHSQDLTQQVNWISLTDAGRFTSPGTLLGERQGVTSVTATLDTKQSGPIFVGVRNAQLLSIDVLPNTASITIGTEQPYQAFGIYSDGSRPDISQSVTWKIEDKKVAYFDPKTLSVIGLTEGSTSITAKLNGVNSSPASITVTEAELNYITLSPINITLYEGDSHSYTVTGHFSDGRIEPIDNTLVGWQSDDTSGVSIIDGVAQAQSAGTYVITATYLGHTATANVTVEHSPLSLNVEPHQATIVEGTQLQFTAIADGSIDVTSSATWQSKLNINEGLVTGSKVGEFRVKASYSGLSDEVKLTVTEFGSLTVEVPRALDGVINAIDAKLGVEVEIRYSGMRAGDEIMLTVAIESADGSSREIIETIQDRVTENEVTSGIAIRTFQEATFKGMNSVAGFINLSIKPFESSAAALELDPEREVNIDTVAP
ncbi:Ig-like domain-containing protein [Vibrio aestuarianus]|uniref:Ig-like domain-containing protein n=1 Tax=Vibrio aestuarianus TaxID=28171 RepID=UPI00237CD056|nr:Ig-like domain-containing protein [Vibrio aestuarianus]MDE1330058.1 Ig-like domain-containing protein [Vibrio aestuarianus]